MIKKIFLLAALIGFLVGCAQVAESTPTPFPADYVPTAIAMTGQAMTSTSLAAIPTNAPPTETPTLEEIPPTAAPSITPTPAPGYSFARIRFLEPGPTSKIVSPLNLQIIVVVGDSKNIKIDLFGEDGRVLFTQIVHVNYFPTGAYETYRIPFEIRAAAEKGILQISTLDKAGRIEALNTLNVFLLSEGIDQNNPPGNVIYERCVLNSPPLKDASASGGTVDVQGSIWPFDEPDHALFVDLILPDGTIAGSRVLSLNGKDQQDFETTLIYRIKEPTLALLSIRQMSSVLKAPIYIYTQPILLTP